MFAEICCRDTSSNEYKKYFTIMLQKTSGHPVYIHRTRSDLSSARTAATSMLQCRAASRWRSHEALMWVPRRWLPVYDHTTPLCTCKTNVCWWYKNTSEHLPIYLNSLNDVCFSNNNNKRYTSLAEWHVNIVTIIFTRSSLCFFMHQDNSIAMLLNINAILILKKNSMNLAIIKHHSQTCSI